MDHEEMMHAPDDGEAVEPSAEGQGTTAFTDKEATRVLLMERMLLSALREQDAATAADLARRRAEFLADASLRFGASLDQEITYGAIAGLGLPGLDAWCVVDVVEVGGGLRRIAALHSDDDKRVATRSLIAQWPPTDDGAIGVLAVASTRASLIINDPAVAAAALRAGVHDPGTLRVIEELGAASLLIVPVIAHDVLLGAITFVTRVHASPYTPEDIRFGEALAARCAQAFESARLYAAARAAWAEADDARTEAERANRAKSEFLAVMSHELRTPLNAIAGYTELIELGIHGPVTAEQARALGRIQQSQRHLLGLITSVLNYSRVEAGAVEYAIDQVPLREVLSTGEALIAPQAQVKQLRVRSDGCDPRAVARADPGKVQQIVLNLLSNAVKFTASGGALTLECARRGAMVVVRVSDTGEGIATDELERVFHPFVQLDAKLTRMHEGTGLGLAISRDLARGMGGELTAESTLGVGSTFTLTLPAEP